MGDKKHGRQGQKGAGRINSVVFDLAFDFHSQRFVMSSEDNCINVYGRKGSRSYDKVAEIKLKDKIRKLEWAPPHFGQIFAAATLNGKSVYIFEETVHTPPKSGTRSQSQQGGGEYKTQFQLCKEIELESKPTGLAFKPGAEPSLKLTLAIPCEDGKVRVFEAKDAMKVNSWELASVLQAGRGPCTAIAWNPNYLEIPSLIVACGRQQGVWEYYEEQFRWILSTKLPDDSHKTTINSLAWAPSMGRSYHLIATGSDAVRIFRITPVIDKEASGDKYNVESEWSNGTSSSVWNVSWNIMGSILCSSDSEGKVHLWKKDLTNWQEIMRAPKED